MGIVSRKSLSVPVALPPHNRLIKRMGTPPSSGICQSPSICRRKRSKSCTPNISTIAKERIGVSPGPFEMDLGAIQVETIESGENARPNIPTCGYLVTHKEKNISVLHTGDLHAPYPALKNIQGRVDFLIHMKLGLTEWGGNHTPHLVDLVDLVQPRYLIPTHYRTDSVSDPIPHGTWPPQRHRCLRLHRVDP